MIRKVLLFMVLLSLAASSGSLAFVISRDWQQSVSSSSTETIDRIQVYLAEGKNSAGVDINEFQLTPYAIRLANNTRVWVPGTTNQTGWYNNGSGNEPVPTFWGVPNSSGLTAQTTTVNPDTGLYVTYVEPMQNWVSADNKVAVIEAPSFILGTFLGIREYWIGTVAPAQAYQATVYYQFYRNGTLVTSATYSKPAGSTSWTRTITGTSSAWNQGFININPGFTITASAGTGGSISPSGAVSVDSGGNQTFTITPNTGYAISSVTVNGVNQGSINSYTFSNVQANHTISATFTSLGRNVPKSDQLLFSAVTDAFPSSGSTGNWPTFWPTGGTLTMIGTPVVETLAGVKWEQNLRADLDGYRLGRYSDPIAVNGATIVVAAKPVRYGTAEAWTSIVDIFYDRLVLGIRNNTGIVCVKRNINTNNQTQNSTVAIPDGQITILSLVVQPDSSYKVYANGTEIMNVAGTGATVNWLNPDHTDTFGSDPDYTHYINVGRSNPDGWSTFNGNIGDVFVYKVALSDADRQTLEADLTSKFSVSSYTINASAGTGGSISPSGSVSVAPGASQTFSITPSSGYSISQVIVDGANVGAVSSYTFNNVTANHTISATFTGNTYTITASAGTGGSISPSGSVSVNHGGSQTFTITPNSGYVISQVTVNGVNQGAITSYTFNNVTANQTISAAFTTQAPPPTGLVMELRPQDFSGNQWPIYQGSLKDADPTKAYFAPNGKPQFVPSVAGTGYSGIGMNNSVWDHCVGMGGPIAPAGITGNNPRTIEVWTFNPSLAGEETLVDLSHRGGTTGQHFAFENGNNWALNGSGTGDVTNWNSSNRANRWVHLVVTYANGVARFYVDGVNTVTKECVYDIFSGDSIAIGSQRTAATTASNSTSNLNNGVYMGYIGNVRIYDNALTQAEVTSRFGLGINGGETAATTYTVSGTVTTGSNGISGAYVYFSKSASASLSPEYIATTDSSGNYTQSLPAGTWYIAAAKGRYTPNPTADTVVNLTGNTSGRNFTLTYVTTPTKLIDMDAAQLAGNDNDPVSSWANAGTLGGAFSIDGADQSTRPVLSTAIGKRCVTFDGTNDRLKLFSGANPINAPAGLTGNSDWTVSGWYLNPALGSIECYLGWANSNEQVGARAGFMYGSHNGDGAAMHGTGPLMNYNMAMIPLPTTGLWHHIAVTFDGTVEKVYVDGVLNQTENKNLRIGASQPFLMGCWYGNTSGGSPGTWFSGSIASLTVYDQVLTDAEISALGYQQLYTVSGSVKSNTNQPIPGAIVYFNTTANASVNPLLITSTDANGNYSQQVPAGNWYISAMKSRYTPNPASDLVAVVTTANVSGANFTLTPSATLNKLIDLNASALTDGALTTWTNTGSLGGSFGQDGGDGTTRPTVGTVAGKKAVTFDGSNDRLVASFTAPSGITSGSDWTVSAIVYNPAIASDEAYLCWAQRGTASRAAQFCYGSSYSAYHVTNNLAWGTAAPSAGSWHHIAVTYDGSEERTYVDGILRTQATGRYLNLWTGQPVFVGVAYDNATGTTKSQWFSGSMANLQVYNEALTEAEVRSIATVTISGQVTGPTGSPLPGAVVGFKNSTKTTAGLAIAATADADLYVVTDSSGNYSTPILKDNTYYVAAWKDGYAPSTDYSVIADISRTVNISVTSEAGVNLALGRTKEADRLWASPTGLGANSINNGFDGNAATYFNWTTSSQKDLVIDITKSDGTADSINGITLITGSQRVYDWELWVENNTDPIVSNTRNTSANWTKVYQSIGSYGGYDRTAANGQVVVPVKLSTTSARGVWIKIINGSSSETRPLEVMVHSSGGPVSIGSIKTLPDGSYVVLGGKNVCWAPRGDNGTRLTNYFYMSDLDGASGIQVRNPGGALDALYVNNLISVAGTMATDSATGERYIGAAIVPAGDTGTGITPTVMNTQTVQTSTSAVGRFVSVTGTVRQVAPDGSWFTIADGYMSGGVEVQTVVYAWGAQLPAYLASVNDTITVMGSVVREWTANGVKSAILLFNYEKPTGTYDEFTFFCISDVHYGNGSDNTSYLVATHTVDVMNALPGTAYPAGLGGYVQTPRGVILSGDITEGNTSVQFNAFDLEYGINAECRLRYPVFEGLGNHDGRVDGLSGQRVKARTPFRRNLTGVSSNGMHYSWDWGSVHFVQLNRLPVDVSDLSSTMGGDPCYALEFLQQDLATHVGTSGRPVFIAHHYGFEEHSISWWTANERLAYYNAIKDYNVVGITHGHKHAIAKYQWNGTTFGSSLPGGIDVFQDSCGLDKENQCPGGFYVIRIRNNQLAWAQWYYNRTTGQWQWGINGTKTINTP